jgi:hypothetical protein
MIWTRLRLANSQKAHWPHRVSASTDPQFMDGWRAIRVMAGMGCKGWQDDRKHLRCDEARCNSTSRPMVARLVPDKLGVKLRVASVERLLARAHGDLEQARFRRKSPVIYIMGQLQNDPKTTSILLPKATSPIRRQNVDLFIN